MLDMYEEEYDSPFKVTMSIPTDMERYTQRLVEVVMGRQVSKQQVETFLLLSDVHL